MNASAQKMKRYILIREPKRNGSKSRYDPATADRIEDDIQSNYFSFTAPESEQWKMRRLIISFVIGIGAFFVVIGASFVVLISSDNPGAPVATFILVFATFILVFFILFVMVFKTVVRGRELMKRQIGDLAEKARNGDAEAQLTIGVRYFQGDGLHYDPEKAAHWLRMAAEQGHDVAQLNLADLYYRGCGVEQNDGQAAYWVRKAAEQGNAKAQHNLAMLYRDGRGVENNDEEAEKWFNAVPMTGQEEWDYAVSQNKPRR
ncbi:MAG: sel1 repeat family protein [Methylobacteriaceae bacterium]|jgi:hypothetical protein|nr:sel1 repeat family protein [Methylobacteriaceae bacterium]